MKKRTALLLALVLGLTAVAGADETARKGRAVFEALQESCVTLRIVTSISFGGQEQEQDTWTNGAVIGADGLTAIPLSGADPVSMVRRMAPPEMQSQIEAKIVDMEFTLPGGVRVPAETVIRDEDVDVMLVRPKEKPEKPWVHAKLDTPGTPEMLEEVLIIMQLGEIANRARTAAVTRVETIVERPRRFYIVGEDWWSGLIAAPAFTLDGEFIGMGVNRVVAGPDGPQDADAAVIILPAEYIAEAAAQAPPRAEE